MQKICGKVTISVENYFDLSTIEEEATEKFPGVSLLDHRKPRAFVLSATEWLLSSDSIVKTGREKKIEWKYRIAYATFYQ